MGKSFTSSGYGLNDFADRRGFSWNSRKGKKAKEKFQRKGNEYKNNDRDNKSDQTIRSNNVRLNNEARAYNADIPAKRQAEADKFNAKGDKLYTKHNELNKWSDAAVRWAKGTPSGQYVSNRGQILNAGPGGQSELLVALERNGYITGKEREALLFGGGSKNGKGGLLGSYRNYYGSTRVTPWDSKAQGLKPPVGGFDAAYYLDTNEGNANIKDKWNAANSAYNYRNNAGDNLDITIRYGTANGYAYNHYSTVGKSAGYRGNAPERADYTEDYQEGFSTNSEGFTDAEKQYIRDTQLGLTGTRISDGQEIRTVDWEDNIGGALELGAGGSIAEKDLTAQDMYK